MTLGGSPSSAADSPQPGGTATDTLEIHYMEAEEDIQGRQQDLRVVAQKMETIKSQVSAISQRAVHDINMQPGLASQHW